MSVTNSSRTGCCPFLTCNSMGYSEEGEVFSLPFCSSRLGLISLISIGIISLVLGILAVVILGFSQPGTILGIIFVSVGLVLLVSAFLTCRKKILIKKVNELLILKKENNERLSEQLTTALLSCSEAKGAVLDEYRKSFRAIETTLDLIRTGGATDDPSLLDVKRLLDEMRAENKIFSKKIGKALRKVEQGEGLQEVKSIFQSGVDILSNDILDLGLVTSEKLGCLKELTKTINGDIKFIRSTVVEGLINQASLAQLRFFDPMDLSGSRDLINENSCIDQEVECTNNRPSIQRRNTV